MRRLRRGAFVALEVALLAAIPALAWAGFRTVLDTTAGQAVDPELDPDEPGYEAFLGSTPVALFVGTGDDGALSWLTIAALGGTEDVGGALVLIPPATLVEDVEDVEDEDGVTTTLAAVYADGGRPVLAQAVADLVGAGFDEVVVIEPARMVELVAPVSPLTISLADPVPGFETGEQPVEAALVPALLSTRGPNESDLARMDRNERFWRAWLAAVGASTDPDAVPGERSAGVGRYVRGLAAGAVTFDVLPVDPVVDPATGEERFQPDAESIDALIDERVPFPVASRPGARPRVRVLDAVGADGLALRAARDAVRGGGQVVAIGNADRFGAETSRIVYFDAGFAAAAAEIAETMGITEVDQREGPNPNDLVDLTVVVGRDLAGAYGLQARTGGGDAG